MRFRFFKGKAKQVEAESAEREIARREPRPVVEPVEPLVQYKMLDRDGVEGISVVVRGKGQQSAVKDAHPNYDAIVEAAKAGDPDVLDLFNIAQVAGVRFMQITDRVSEAYGKIFIDGNEVDSALSAQIVEFVRNKLPFDGLVKFAENIYDNPNEHARESLFGWISADDNKRGITITDDGLLVGYKSVKSTDTEGQFLSVRSGTAQVDGLVIKGQIPNYEGAVVEMQRDSVDFNPNAECSVGLHVGTFAYAESWQGDTLVEVFVNPKDVVSVPDSATSWKMRVRKYVVGKVLDKRHETPLIKTPKNVKTADTSDIRKGDVFADRDARRKGSTKKVIELVDDYTVVVESKSATGKVAKRRVLRSRLVSSKYNRVRRGRKS